MAKTPITLNVDTTLLPTTIAALNWKIGYQATITDTDPQSATYGQQITNPVTPAAAAKQCIIAHVMSCIADYQAMQAQTAITAPASNLIS